MEKINNQWLNEAIEYLITNKKIKKQREISDSLEYSDTSLSEFVNNKKKPSKPFLKKFSKHYGFSEDWLRTGGGRMLIAEDRSPPKSATVKDITQIEVENNMDYKDKYIALLEKQNKALESSENTLQQRLSLLTAEIKTIEETLKTNSRHSNAELTALAIQNTTLLRLMQSCFAEVLKKDEKALHEKTSKINADVVEEYQH